jgi:excisionase family DNA binding protein
VPSRTQRRTANPSPQSYRDWSEVPVACTVEEARHVLGISRETMYRLLRSGEIRSRKVGERRRVIPKTVLREYLGDLEAAG